MLLFFLELYVTYVNVTYTQQSAQSDLLFQLLFMSYAAN